MSRPAHGPLGNLTTFRFTKFIGARSLGRKLSALRPTSLPWAVTYSATSIGIFVAFIVFFRHRLGLDSINYYVSPIGGFAIFGIVAVIGLSVALMGVSFYSSRSGIDDEVGGALDVRESRLEPTSRP
jgi:hypothetical protein